MEITLPRLGTVSKKDLARELTDAYADSTGMDRERIGIRFLEYGEGETAYAGRLLSDRFEELAERKFYYPLDDE